MQRQKGIHNSLIKAQIQIFMRTFLIIFSILLGCIFSLDAQSAKAEKVYKAKITTPFGDMIVKLHNDTPIHRDNFIKNVKSGFYNESLFHRVIQYFMAQGGDPNSINAKYDQSLGADQCGQLPAEIRTHYFHKKGALAAARLPDGINPERKSSACQFYIVQGFHQKDQGLNNMETENFKFSDMARAYYKAQGGSPSLDVQYTIFGEVIEGLEVIDLICAIPTGKYVTSRPNTDISMRIEMID